MYANTPQLCVKNIYAALEKDTRINLHQSSIKVYSEDNIIILEGLVSDITSKRLANNIARSIVKDDFTIEDRLDVGGHSMGDRELKTKVAHILGQEPLFADHTIIVISDGHLEIIHDDKTNASRIMASIKDGIVTLSGKVNSINHRRFAEVLMWWIPGCRRVNNSLEVVPPQSDDDDTLTDAIRLVLEKDPLVHAAQLRVDTRAHIAELKGYLSSEEEHVFALRDTWTVPGVEDVRDNIQVGSLSA